MILDKPLLIKTSRLILKSITIDDEKEMTEYLTDSMISLTYMLPDYKSDDEVLKLFNRFIELSINPKRFVYGIYLDDVLIGFVNDVANLAGEIELGYVIGPKYQNQGFATEVLKVLIAELFKMGYNKITTGAFEYNTASIRVMEKSGMRKVDFEEDIFYKGLNHHCVYYEIKKGE